ncbi:MAG TPA: hypothetical protein VN843_28405 [Anaerolineales bacterium]|nr:hypothetical protein [Anaerolineales bacterium]
MNNQTDPLAAPRQAMLEEYKSLRDETLKRVEFRYQIFNLTLIVAGSLWTIGTAKPDLYSVLLLYPILSFFFSAAFVYNSILLVQIGAYIREKIEPSGVVQLGWATYLKDKYKGIEPFEIVSTYGLFLGTQIVSLLAYFNFAPPFSTLPRATQILIWLGFIAVALTLLTLLYPLIYHKRVLAVSQASPPK